MNKNYKQTLLLLRDIETIIESRDFLSDEEERILDEIKTIFTKEQEDNNFFEEYIREKYTDDYLHFEEENPLNYEEWREALEFDTDTRYNYFISFLQS